MRGDLVITKEKVNYNKAGKRYADYVVGRESGHEHRVICDCDGGYVISKYNLNISDAYKVTLSCLGYGVVDTYIAAPDLESAKTHSTNFLAGKAADVLGRSIRNIFDGAKKENTIVLSISHMSGKVEEPVKTAKVVKQEVPKAPKVKKVKAEPRFGFVDYVEIAPFDLDF